MAVQADRNDRILVCVSKGLTSPSGLPPYNTSPVMQMRFGWWARREETTGAGSELCRSERRAREGAPGML